MDAPAPPLRLLALLAAVLVLAVACADGAGQPDAADEGEVAADETDGDDVAQDQPGDDEPADADADDGDTDAAPAGNPDGCLEEVADGDEVFVDQVGFEHADGVSVDYHGTYKVVEVTPPDLGDAEPVRTVLLQCGAPEPDLDGDLADAQVIEVPTDEVISLTTTNLPHFDELEAVERLVGVGTADYITTDAVREAADGDDVGEFATAEGAPDLEGIIDADPDLLLMDGFGEEILDDVARFTDAGVPTVIQADFDERTLLGRAEWIKFTALFLNAEAEAEAVFDGIAADYHDTRDAAADAADADGRPTVFANEPFEGTWFAPGGDSFFAGAVDDAGGDYVFADEAETGSLALDIETVLDRAGDADVWLQAGSVHGSLDDLAATDERLTEFTAFQSDEVWAYDMQTTPEGGNAVFEEAYTRADLFLADLVSILHPDAVPEHERRYFGRVGSDG